MTTKELNRDVKRMYKHHFEKLEADEDNMEYFKFKDGEGKKEFMRLYWSDRKLEYLNRENIIRMMIINQKCRYIQFHLFYCSTDQKALI